MRSTWLLIILLLLTGILLESWKIGQSDAEEWDESRRGINAISMMKSGEYFQYHFLDVEDNFNTKPPLTVWLIILNFKLLGISNFALRFHSVIAIIFFFFYISKIILLYREKTYLVFFLGIIISVNGIIGFHVGRSGDTDSLLVLFLTAFLFYFLKYWDFGEKASLYFAAVTLGLAFYAKSVAIFLMLPGVFVFMLIYWEKEKIFNRTFFLATFIFLFMISLLVIIPSFIRTNGGGGNNLLVDVFSVDFVRRFMDNSFEAGYDPFHVFHVLDMNFSIWIYIFYGGVAYGSYLIIKRKNLSELIHDRFLVLSILIVISYALLLTISMNKHRWYIAPAIPFFGILTTEFIYRFKGKQWLQPFYFILVIVLVVMKFLDYNDPDDRARRFFNSYEDKISGAEHIYVDPSVSQDLIWEYVKLNPETAGFLPEEFPKETTWIYFGPMEDQIPGEYLGSLEANSLIMYE
jgi:4-amino-4-deoxy-L-arabinose transferase-like glycosyltransferase